MLYFTGIFAKPCIKLQTVCRKAYVKFDLGVTKVKVNPGSSFVQTIIGWSPQCFTPSFVDIGVEIGPPVPEKYTFKVFTIYGHGGHLGHVTSQFI